MRPKQKVIVYRHGLRPKSQSEYKARYYREHSGKQYFSCPGGCGVEVTLINGAVRKHYSDFKNRTPCLFKGPIL